MSCILILHNGGLKVLAALSIGCWGKEIQSVITKHMWNWTDSWKGTNAHSWHKLFLHGGLVTFWIKLLHMCFVHNSFYMNSEAKEMASVLHFASSLHWSLWTGSWLDTMLVVVFKRLRVEDMMHILPMKLQSQNDIHPISVLGVNFFQRNKRSITFG